MSLNDNRYHVKSDIEAEQHFSFSWEHSVNSLFSNLPSLRYCAGSAPRYIYKLNFEEGE